MVTYVKNSSQQQLNSQTFMKKVNHVRNGLSLTIAEEIRAFLKELKRESSPLFELLRFLCRIEEG